MKKLKAAFFVFKQSLTEEHYYKDIIKMNLGFSIKYIFVMALLATAITLPKVAKPLLTDFKETLNSLSASMLELYPEDLIINIKEGKISINQPEPYYFKMPGELEEYSTTENEEEYPENLIVFDSMGTLDDLDIYKTIVLVNDKNILIKESNSIEVYPLKDAPDTEVTKEKFAEGVSTLDKFIKVLPYIVLVMVVIISLVYYFGFRLVYLFPVAFILHLIGKSRNQKYEFKQYYMIAIHAMTMPLVFEVIASLISLNVELPFWFMLLNLVVGILAVIKLEENNIDSEIQL